MTSEHEGGAGWHADERVSPVAMGAPNGGGLVHAATRTLANLLAIMLMVLVVGLAVAAFMMNFYYKDQLARATSKAPEDIRAIVEYRDQLRDVTEDMRTDRFSVLDAPATPKRQAELDLLLKDNADLRAAYQARRNPVRSGDGGVPRRAP